jgi:predicted MPP superfamily phosphohydrolase
MKDVSGSALWLGMATGALGLLGSGIYSFAVERFRLEICRVRMTLPHLPQAFSGMRIALFSDVHLGFYYSADPLSHVVDRINELQPDVICFTGDLIDSASCLPALEPALPVLEKLHAPLGKFAVLGNHDYRSGAAPIIEGLRRSGFRVLRNESAILQKGEERIYLIGLDDVLEGHADLRRAMETIPEQACTILLVHEPDFADTARHYPVSLQLSGHSHGGQVRIPFLWPFFTSRLGKKYVAGSYMAGNLRIYTNRGVGTTTLPLRFLCRPEITEITLIKSSRNQN